MITRAAWVEPLQNQWANYGARFAALSLREKVIVSFAAVFCVGYLGFNVAVEPHLIKARKAENAIEQAKKDKAAMQPQLELLKNRDTDPDLVNRQRLEQLRQQLAESGERIAKFQSAMVPPDRMHAFLENVLRQNRNLELMGFKTLPVLPVGTSQEGKAESSGAAGASSAPSVSSTPPASSANTSTNSVPATTVSGIYQHGIEITLAGSYNDLLAYLTELEKTPQRVMWNSISLTANYPRSVLTLRVYTLSLDKHWLTV